MAEVAKVTANLNMDNQLFLSAFTTQAAYILTKYDCKKL